MKDNLNYCPIPDPNQQTVYEANVGQNQKAVVIIKNNGEIILNGKRVEPGSLEEDAAAFTVGLSLEQKTVADKK